MQACVFDQKRSIAATEFYFEWLRRWKKSVNGQRLDDGAQFDDQITFHPERLLGALVNPSANQTNLVGCELLGVFALGHKSVRIIADVRDGHD